jgi:hypothetical protein
MEEENRNDLASVESVLGGKWFWPILSQLDELEGRLLKVFPFMAPVLSDNAPEWSFQCLSDVAFADAKINGACDARGMGAREIGRMVGSKFALCETFARAHQIFKAYSAEQLASLEEKWEAEPGFLAECIELYREFADDLAPRMREIKKKALLLVAEQGLKEEVDYFQGFPQGAESVKVMFGRLKLPKNKRQVEHRTRMCVYFFAIVHGVEIDGVKRDASWPELYEAFMEFVNHEIDLDEETFKKLLARKGLKGVGKAGRPVKAKELGWKRKRQISDSDSE